jgi:hypothetical protein
MPNIINPIISKTPDLEINGSNCIYNRINKKCTGNHEFFPPRFNAF